MNSAAVWTTDLFYPPKCVVCSRLMPNGRVLICPACLRKLPILIAPIRREGFPGPCIAPFCYEGQLRESLLRFKFAGYVSYARLYTLYMAAVIRNNYAGKYDLITWVPISRLRWAERGFNQAQILAQQVARQLGCQSACTLKKVKHNKRQSSLSDRAARRANVRNVYRAFRPEHYRGKRVLLVDDIITSGATLAECSRVLRKAGASEVLCVTAAAAQSH